MGKTLLQKFTSSKNENDAAVIRAEEHTALPQLMQEMKKHLDEAAKDLLQPRQEAIDQLLKKALH